MDIYSNKNTDVSALNNLTRFNGFLDNRYLDPHINGYAFIFITKPSLFIAPTVEDQNNSQEVMAFENMKRDPRFAKFIGEDTLNEEDALIPKLLSFKKYKDSRGVELSNFLVPFTNGIEGFAPKDINMETEQTFVTKQGHFSPMPTFKTSSYWTVTCPTPL